MDTHVSTVKDKHTKKNARQKLTESTVRYSILCLCIFIILHWDCYVYWFASSYPDPEMEKSQPNLWVRSGTFLGKIWKMPLFNRYQTKIISPKDNYFEPANNVSSFIFAFTTIKIQGNSSSYIPKNSFSILPRFLRYI